MSNPDGAHGVELNGILAGWVWSVEGGHATSDIAITFGTGMKKAFYDWIQDFFEGRSPHKDGSIVTATPDHKATSRLAFTGALITELGMPALDASSKDAAKMTVRISPRLTRAVPLPVSEAARALSAGPASPKPWICSNFRLKIDGLDCSSVTRVEAITVKQKVVEHAVGGQPASLEVSNLVITLPESHADAWRSWQERSAGARTEVKDSHDLSVGERKSGTLEYLAPDMKEVLFTLAFTNLGIFNLTPEKVESGSEQIRRVKVEMYCEDIKFDYKAAWA